MLRKSVENTGVEVAPGPNQSPIASLASEFGQKEGITRRASFLALLCTVITPPALINSGCNQCSEKAEDFLEAAKYKKELEYLAEMSKTLPQKAASLVDSLQSARNSPGKACRSVEEVNTILTKGISSLNSLKQSRTIRFHPAVFNDSTALLNFAIRTIDTHPKMEDLREGMTACDGVIISRVCGFIGLNLTVYKKLFRLIKEFQQNLKDLRDALVPLVDYKIEEFSSNTIVNEEQKTRYGSNPPAKCYDIPPDLKKGDNDYKGAKGLPTGEKMKLVINGNVTLMQNSLINNGCLPPGTNDGFYGGDTEKAIASYQIKNGLSREGMINPETARSLSCQ